jgi:copper(I)-binding protein
MRKTLIQFAAAIALTLSAILAPGPGAIASSVMVMKAYARASATPTAEAGAAYVSLMLHGDADRLVAVSTPAARMAGLHRTVETDGVMKMEHVDGIDIPAHGMLEMKPGGYHIMLMGLNGPLREGDEIALTLTFEKAGKVQVKARVGGVAAGAN